MGATPARVDSVCCSLKLKLQVADRRPRGLGLGRRNRPRGTVSLEPECISGRNALVQDALDLSQGDANPAVERHRLDVPGGDEPLQRCRSIHTQAARSLFLRQQFGARLPLPPSWSRSHGGNRQGQEARPRLELCQQEPVDLHRAFLGIHYLAAPNTGPIQLFLLRWPVRPVEVPAAPPACPHLGLVVVVIRGRRVRELEARRERWRRGTALSGKTPKRFACCWRQRGRGIRFD